MRELPKFKGRIITRRIRKADQEVLAVVDQSIQPGDGGTGLALSLQGYQTLAEKILFTANLFYLFNAQESNGVLTRNGNSEFSCADQFAARLGAFYVLPIPGFSVYLGGRAEGVPATDLIGSSDGYRRPGYALSVEPGLNYGYHNFFVNLSVPVALYRNRTQSYQDKVRTQQSGNYVHGDAAFADYVINLNLNYRFGGHAMPKLEIQNL